MKDNLLPVVLCIGLLSLMVSAGPMQRVIYVNAGNAAGPWDGKSWATAYKTVREGLKAVQPGAEIWVAKGTYMPTEGTDRTASFRLKPGVALYGGFDGTETRRDQRNWGKNRTILSGDIGLEGDSSDNLYHVVTGAYYAALDGFTITGGNADGEAHYSKGGGMVNYFNASPTVANCTFTANAAGEGGGMYNYHFSSPRVTNCTFVGNSADMGGAMVNRDGACPWVVNCIFKENYARWRGGAVLNDYGASPAFYGCTFSGNTTRGCGGGMYTDDNSSQLGFTRPVVSNCTFERNRARCRGGAMANYNRCTPLVYGCIFTSNHARKGGGAVANDYGAVAMVNECTFNDNSADEGNADIDTR